MSHQPTNPETVLGNKPLSLVPPRPRAEVDYFPCCWCQERLPTRDARFAHECGCKADAPYAGGNDGPIREPGDTAPKRSDVYSDSDLCDLLGRHAISLARLGMTHIATDLDAACAALDERADQIEEARVTVQRLLDKLSSLGYGNCPRDDRCLMNHDHAGGCVTSHSELARIRRAADEAESIDE